MSATALAPATNGTLADLLEEIGSIPLERVARYPAPGTATETDLLSRLEERRGQYELVDGVLVEKAMGYYESLVASLVNHLIHAYLEHHPLGAVSAADGTVRLAPKTVRIPDVGFYSWDRFPGRKAPRQPIPDLTPDLAVEVLSAGNTPAEMRRKLHDYFQAGTRLVWLIDPKTATARMFTSPTDVIAIDADGELDGGVVLPGFRLSLRELFARANGPE
ncbi:MAG: Uma2 family endonuclease [Actinomycetota bacterium]